MNTDEYYPLFIKKFPSFCWRKYDVFSFTYPCNYTSLVTHQESWYDIQTNIVSNLMKNMELQITEAQHSSKDSIWFSRINRVLSFSCIS
jgi:hypothetical protein